MTTTKQTLLETALYYASLGYQVFPIKERNKKPPLTAHGFQDADTDEKKIRNWWGKIPNANIGIRCDGLLVLDFDGYAGIEALNLLQQDHGDLPATWTVRTGGGIPDDPHEQGQQLIFRVPKNINIRPGARKYGYENMDIRANDSYIVAAGSVTRLPYETVYGSPESLSDAPEWLIKLALDSQPGKTKNAQPISESVAEGSRNSTLTSLAGSMRSRGLSQDVILASLIETNTKICKPPLPDSEVEAIANSINRYEAGKPGSNGHKEQIPSGPGWVSMADIQSEIVSWLWYPYLPLGKLTLFEGDPGIGKSWVTLAIATAVSLGTKLPFQSKMEYEGKVLIASAEDGLGDTIRPRLESMKANLNNIAAIPELMTLDDAGYTMLDKYISEILPVLLIIDPLIAYFPGDTDIHRANAVRWSTSRLAKIAEKWHLAIIAVRHLTKGGSQKAIYRGLGSIDFTASARSILLAGCDPDNEQVRGIVHIKSNLAKTGEAIGFELREDGFYWLDHSELTSERILAGRDENESQKEAAKRFLKEYLTPGPASWSELTTEAEGCGISEVTLRRARDDMKLEHIQQGELGKRGGGKHYWGLPGKKDLLDH